MKQILLMLVFMSQAMAQDFTDPLKVYEDVPIDPRCCLEIVSREMPDDEYLRYAAQNYLDSYKELLAEGKLDPDSLKDQYLHNNPSPNFSDNKELEEFYRIMDCKPYGDIATEESLFLVEETGTRVLAEKRVFVTSPAACGIVGQFGPPRFVEVNVFGKLIGYLIEKRISRNYFLVPQDLVTDRSNVTCDFLLGLAKTQLRVVYEGPVNF